jgi:hypothetical protein
LKKEKKKLHGMVILFIMPKPRKRSFLVGGGGWCFANNCCMGELVRKIKANVFRST